LNYLTPKEKIVHHELLTAKSLSTIAADLGITEHTIKKHAGNIYIKCNVPNRLTLVVNYYLEALDLFYDS